jgi:hypothetical protein
MIFEWRTYELKAGKALEYLQLFRTLGVESITTHLPLGGYFLTETGTLNRIHHLWIYESFVERTAARQNLAQEETWNRHFVPAAFPLIERQRNAFLSLRQGSPLLDLACTARRTRHGPQSPDAPLFAPRLLTLTHSAAPLAAEGEVLGRWQAASGHATGAFITLAAAPEETLQTPPESAVLEHELLRPLSFSPLR